MEISTSRHITGTLVVSMKPRSWKLFWQTISLSSAFVVLLVGSLLIYATGLGRADYECMTHAGEGDSFSVELDISSLSWKCVLTDYEGVSTEVRLPLY
jgi:hypothetical protein